MTRVVAWNIETCPYPIETIADAQQDRYEKEEALKRERQPDMDEADAPRLVRIGHGLCVEGAPPDVGVMRLPLANRRLTAAEGADHLLPVEDLFDEALNAEKWLRDIGRTQAAAILLLNIDGTVSRACDRCRSFFRTCCICRLVERIPVGVVLN